MWRTVLLTAGVAGIALAQERAKLGLVGAAENMGGAIAADSGGGAAGGGGVVPDEAGGGGGI